MSAPLMHVSNPPILASDLPLPERWLIDREAWEAQFQEMWYLNQEEEPSTYSGKSILVRWLNPFEDEGKKGWSCCVPVKGEEGKSWCTYKIGRLDRAITHVRGHLGLKPFSCKGQCGNLNCSARFGSNENRNAHYQGPDRRTCDWCKKEELRQNFTRHKESCPQKPSQPMAEELESPTSG